MVVSVRRLGGSAVVVIGRDVSVLVRKLTGLVVVRAAFMMPSRDVAARRHATMRMRSLGHADIAMLADVHMHAAELQGDQTQSSDDRDGCR